MRERDNHSLKLRWQVVAGAGDEMELHVFVDNSSVEIFNSEGTMSLTNIVFPREAYNRITGVGDISYCKLSSIW